MGTPGWTWEPDRPAGAAAPAPRSHAARTRDPCASHPAPSACRKGSGGEPSLPPTGSPPRRSHLPGLNVRVGPTSSRRAARGAAFPSRHRFPSCRPGSRICSVGGRREGARARLPGRWPASRCHLGAERCRRPAPPAPPGSSPPAPPAPPPRALQPLPLQREAPRPARRSHWRSRSARGPPPRRGRARERMNEAGAGRRRPPERGAQRGPVSAPGRAGLGGGDAPRGAGPPPAGVGSAAGARCRWAGAGGMEAAGGPGGARARGLRGAPRPPLAGGRDRARKSAPQPGCLRGIGCKTRRFSPQLPGREASEEAGGGAPARTERGAAGRVATWVGPGADALPGAARSRRARHLLRLPLPRQGGNRRGAEVSRGRRGFVRPPRGERGLRPPGPGHGAGGSGPQLRRRRPRTCPPPHHARSRAGPRAADWGTWAARVRGRAGKDGDQDAHPPSRGEVDTLGPRRANARPTPGPALGGASLCREERGGEPAGAVRSVPTGGRPAGPGPPGPATRSAGAPSCGGGTRHRGRL